MSRKFACLFLAVSTLLCTLAIAYAAEQRTQHIAYRQAVSALDESGLAPHAASALTEGSSLALAAELGMLEQRGTMTLSQLGARAMQVQQHRQREAEAAARLDAQQSAFLALYDGVLLLQSAAIRTEPSADASAVRTVAAGKVAALTAIDDSGWYRVSFAGSEGWLDPACGEGVRYADYANTAAVRDLVKELIDYAYTWLGTPYVYGGSSYRGTDCSGFTMRCFGHIGISLRHGAQDQYRRATPVTTAQRAAGDLVFFTAPGVSGIGHVGIYLGGGRFIHAGSSTGVTVSSLSQSYWAQHYYGAARIIYD